MTLTVINELTESKLFRHSHWCKMQNQNYENLLSDEQYISLSPVLCFQFFQGLYQVSSRGWIG